METKICTRCKQSKLLTEYSKHRKGLRAKCNDCMRQYGREWSRLNPERVAAIDRRRKLKKLYGVTPEWYLEQLEQQGGCCAICGTASPGKRITRFCVDHDHLVTAGGSRGLLCLRCNLGVGWLEDNLDDVFTYLGYGKPLASQN